MGPLTSINRWFSILRGLEYHDSEWTLECISVQKLMEQRLRRPMNETEARLVWPNAGGGKETPEGEIKALREANNKETIKFFVKLSDVPLRIHARHIQVLMQSYASFTTVSQRVKKNPAQNKRWYHRMAGAVRLSPCCVPRFQKG